MRSKDFLIVTLWPLPLLLVPLVAMRFTSEVVWGAFDFAAAWFLLAGAAFAYKLVTWRLPRGRARIAAALVVGTSLMLVWANLAVGIIGNEDNPANLLYGAVLAVGFFGAIISQLRPHGLAVTTFAMAGVHLAVTIIALFVTRPEYDEGHWARELFFNAIFAAMFVGAGLLFRQSGPALGEPGAAVA